MMNDDDRDDDDDRHDDDDDEDVGNKYSCPCLYTCVQYYQSGRYLPPRIEYLIHEEHLSDFPVTDCNMVCLLLPLAAYSTTG